MRATHINFRWLTGANLGNLTSGSGVPSGGTDGDYYIDTATGLVYGPKSGTWPAALLVPALDNVANVVAPNPTNGQVLKFNGTNWVNDTDLTTGGTGVLISGATTPPAAGTGANGDYYLCTATGLIWGPKAAGAWPATAIRTSQSRRRAADRAIAMDGSTNIKVALNADLVTYGYIELEPGNASDTTQDFAPDGSYRTHGPILVPRFGELIGHNSWIAVDSGWTARERAFTPIVAFLGSAGLGSLNSAKITGVRVSGDLQTNATTKVVGIHVGGQYTNGEFITTICNSIVEDVSAQQCHIGINIYASQYNYARGMVAANNNINYLHTQQYPGGGMVDMPNMQDMLAAGGKVGHAFQLERGEYPIAPYALKGVWAKQLNTAFAVFWDSSASAVTSSESAQIIIEGGSTEYNTAGTGGEADTETFTFATTRPTVDDYTTFTVDIPKCEVWVQKYAVLILRNVEFQTASTGIVALLGGPRAGVVFDGGGGPEQAIYQVRAQDESAYCDLLGRFYGSGGIFENVRTWPQTWLAFRGTDADQANYAAVMCGYGSATEKYADLETSLNLTTFSNRVSPDFSSSAGNVTASTAVDSGDSGDTVTTLAFPATTLSNTRGLTPWLEGGASAASYSNSYWAITTFELKNTHSADVRMVVYLRSDSAYIEGNDPGQKAATVPQAITLWGGSAKRWQRVSIMWKRNVDARLCIEVLSPVDTVFTVYVRRLSHVRFAQHRRALAVEALRRGLWR